MSVARRGVALPIDAGQERGHSRSVHISTLPGQNDRPRVPSAAFSGYFGSRHAPPTACALRRVDGLDMTRGNARSSSRKLTREFATRWQHRVQRVHRPGPSRDPVRECLPPNGELSTRARCPWPPAPVPVKLSRRPRRAEGEVGDVDRGVVGELQRDGHGALRMAGLEHRGVIGGRPRDFTGTTPATTRKHEMSVSIRKHKMANRDNSWSARHRPRSPPMGSWWR